MTGPQRSSVAVVHRLPVTFMSCLPESSCEAHGPAGPGGRTPSSWVSVPIRRFFPCTECILCPIRSPLLGKQSCFPPGAGQPRHLGPHEGPWFSWSLWGESPPSVVVGGESLGQKIWEDQDKKEKEQGREAKEGWPHLPRAGKEGDGACSLPCSVFIICSKETLTCSGSLTGESGRWWKGGGR